MDQLPLISRILHRVLLPVIFILSGTMFLVVMAQVVFRYLLAAPLPWSEELARYLMVWVASLAASEAYALGGHVGVNLLVDSLPSSKQWLVRLAGHAGVGILMAVIIYQGFLLIFIMGDQESPGMGVQMAWAYLAVPVGACLIMLNTAGLFWMEITKRARAGQDLS